MLPLGACEAGAVSISGNAKEDVGTGWDEKNPVGVALGGLVSWQFVAVEFWEYHLKCMRMKRPIQPGIGQVPRSMWLME